MGELLQLAQVYRGWSKRRLAKELGRDASNIIPDSGIPKLDLVVRLATALDWPVQDIADALGESTVVPRDQLRTHETFEQLDRAAVRAHGEGRYADLVRLATRAFDAATTATERARACNRELGGHDGQGHYRQALECAQRALRETGMDLDWEMLIRSNLANAHYSLWELYEGKGVAGDVVDALKDSPDHSPISSIALATARYVRGNCLRRLIGFADARASTSAAQAIGELRQSSELFQSLATELSIDSYGGIANTCEGGIVEAEVALGQSEPVDALERYVNALDTLRSLDDCPKGDLLESYGWWCIFGCNVALRHVADPRKLQHYMAIFTNKADEIANHLGNWALRERVFTMEFARRQRFADWTGVHTDWTIDQDDLQRMTGTMGRFPMFQKTGWEILRKAKIVREN
ncbi:MAG: helix-turn-helix domain-containing protein [Acidimicrobiia bacterium]|nr:helix-turn-helix domain-containing protein [Acidimicrobiia bacterium]NNF41499.1 hypothetical protein [Phycisphaerales bacterium]